MPRSRPEDLTETACRGQALDLLARREHSRLELERKLLARSYSDDLVMVTLDGLERTGALAVGRFVESFVRSRTARGQGPVRIRAELAKRGVDVPEAAALLGAESIDWFEAARSAWAKRFGASPPADFKERARQARFLAYRGFEHAHINAALDLSDDSD